MSKNIAARIPKELEKEIDDYMKDKGLDKSAAIRKILETGIFNWKIEKALTLYKLKRVSLWKASHIANLSLREMMDELNNRKIPLNISSQDIIDDIKAAQQAEL
ncbi:MAG TPA: UPF0175 family protein [Candidatus Deferrimicrobium sp.]|nr:UPF0175 family protein [Candidatus Deferrimicrobium sp.]